MRTFVCVLAVLAITSAAMAETFTENFNSYTAGTTSWGSGGVWNEPVSGLKLDAYTADGTLGPRTGNTGSRSAHAELENSLLNPGEYGVGRIDFSALFYWDHARNKNDGFFVVLSDDPAAALLVPTDNSSTASPINAIAWGHSNTDKKNYSFFDGQSWTVIGFTTQPGGGTNDWEVVSGYIEADESWSASSDGGGSGAGTLAVSNFSFDTVSVISQGDSSGYYSGIDNISVSFVSVPEPSTLVLLALGLPLLVMRYRRRR